MSTTPQNTTDAVGKRSEEAACQYLKGKQYRILGRNWSRKWGELDIIAEADKTICFIEVKGESDSRPGFEAWRRAGHVKLKKVQRTARTWLAAHDYPNGTSWRIDILQVRIEESGQNAHITHFKGVSL